MSTPSNAMAGGFAVVLAAGELERIWAVSNMASVAAASDMDVDVFCTMDGLEAFDVETVENGTFQGGEIAKAMMTSEDVDVPTFIENFERGKELGPLSLWACEMSMDLMGRELDDYVGLFDGTLGVAGFLGKAANKEVIFV